MLAAHVEWRLRELIPGSQVRVALTDEDGPPGRHTDRNFTAPGTDAPRGRSAAHAGALTMVAAAEDRLGCDLELVRLRGEGRWREVLGPERLALAKTVAREAGEDLDTAATRVWAALEALKKAGAPWHESPALVGSHADRWVCLRAFGSTIATCAAALRGQGAPLVLAVLAREGTSWTATNTGIA